MPSKSSHTLWGSFGYSFNNNFNATKNFVFFAPGKKKFSFYQPKWQNLLIFNANWIIRPICESYTVRKMLVGKEHSTHFLCIIKSKEGLYPNSLQENMSDKTKLCRRQPAKIFLKVSIHLGTNEP